MKLTDDFDTALGDILAPADVIAAKVRDTLAADDKLQKIFKPERIEVVDRLRGIDYGEYPRLQISPYSEEQVAGTTNVDTNVTRLYIRIRYEEATWQSLIAGESDAYLRTVGTETRHTLRWPFGVPSMATLEWHIFRVLKADSGLEVHWPDGQILDLCDPNPRFGPSNFSDDEPDPQSGRFASNHTIQVEYTSYHVHSNRTGGTSAGKFANAAATGG